eukprot:11302192-Heterocapsa_arctica.AAC.1
MNVSQWEQPRSLFRLWLCLYAAELFVAAVQWAPSQRGIANAILTYNIITHNHIPYDINIA